MVPLPQLPNSNNDNDEDKLIHKSNKKYNFGKGQRQNKIKKQKSRLTQKRWKMRIEIDISGKIEQDADTYFKSLILICPCLTTTNLPSALSRTPLTISNNAVFKNLEPRNHTENHGTF